jgi:hypothetical protein
MRSENRLLVLLDALSRLKVGTSRFEFESSLRDSRGLMRKWIVFEIPTVG